MTNQIPPPFRNPAALMVLRAWIEVGSTLPLRAYIPQSGDVSAGFERSATVTDVEAAVGEVRAWLEALLADEAVMPDPASDGGVGRRNG